ncbi:UNVERIFIED_CONTAM: hypothetical protein Sradi_0197200 [Sesamum radiatum]|uniref:Uncharacterized protein n=1 Tax=Sesamum radiatum TaxID=300843 RepID=A0AAW2W036_SESRA
MMLIDLILSSEEGSENNMARRAGTIQHNSRLNIVGSVVPYDYSAGQLVLSDVDVKDIPLTFTAVGIKLKPTSRRGRSRKGRGLPHSSNRKRSLGIILIETDGKAHESKRRCQLVDEDSNITLAEVATQPCQQP